MLTYFFKFSRKSFAMLSFVARKSDRPRAGYFISRYSARLMYCLNQINQTGFLRNTGKYPLRRQLGPLGPSVSQGMFVWPSLKYVED